MKALVNQESGSQLVTSKSEALKNEANLADEFLCDVESTGLVGEQANALTVLLSAVSARLESPLNLTVCGESSAGKNHLLGCVAAFIPEEHKKFLTGMTPKTLMYSGETEFQHKAVFIAEYEGVAKADYAIRTMQSEKLINWEFVDTKKGIQKKSCTVLGPAAFLQATTRTVLHSENETRQLFIRIDESPGQTMAIMERKALQAATGARESYEHIFPGWHDFLRSLTLNSVLIPFSQQLIPHFPADKVRSRRDLPKLLGLIEASAYLHQHQREKRDNAIVATIQDYRLARPLFMNCYARTPDVAIKELVDAAEKMRSQDIRVSDLMARLGWGRTKTYDVLSRAQEMGCIAETEIRGIYRFIRNSAIPPLDLPETL